jgi:LysR family transcriptional activator of mexEF-oprN operon
MSLDINEIELRRLDLNLLLVFAALMRERSVSRAAARLRLGASAVSMALARLRTTVGDDLFVRMGPGMQPTPRAEALWLLLAPALGSVQQAMRGARGFDPALSELVIRFAAPDDLEFVLIPELMALMEQRAPHMRLIVRPSDFRTLLAALDGGDADLALSATPQSGLETRHRVQPLHRDTFAVLFDPVMIGSVGPLDLETYLALPHLLLSPAGHLHGPMDERLAEMGRARTVLAALSHFPTMPFLLKRRRAIVNMPSIAAGYYAAAYGLAVCPPPLASPDFEVALIWHVRTDGDPAHAWFRNVVANVVSSLSGGQALT